tara:strand:+ start:692 stop:925 length:234 start_codon:yes stop_codon:yes gene_type:complete
LRNDSIPLGKKENSIRKPLPNSIKTNIIDVAKNIVVKASISNDIVIYKFPNKNKYITKHKNKNNVLETLRDIDVKVV